MLEIIQQPELFAFDREQVDGAEMSGTKDGVPFNQDRFDDIDLIVPFMQRLDRV